MSKAEWKIDENDEAVFIDCEEEARDEGYEYEDDRWSILPDLILEQVLSYLSIRERYYASMACRNWNRVFRLPRVWAEFTLEDETLTRRKFNYYYGWQHVLDHFRTQVCITKVGRNFRHLIFKPIINFHNLYEFMCMFSYYAERIDEEGLKIGVGPSVNKLTYHFPCSMANRDDIERARTFGTGGKLLDSLKRLMGNLESLRRLELVDLMLDPKEAQYLLDEVCVTCCLTLRTLNIVNATKMRYQILHAGVFLNLQVLVMSPHNVGEDLVQLLGHSSLRHLHIVQNRYTPPPDPSAPSLVSSKTWQGCTRNNPHLAVHLQLKDTRVRHLVHQPGAPVQSVVYDTPFLKMETHAVMTSIDLYGIDLKVFAHCGLPRFHQVRSFHERCDSLLLLLCRQCPYLHTLMVRERVSTATVLLLAHTATNLRHLFVRRNAVVLRCDWPHSPDWSDDFNQWLRASARSYEAVEREVSQIFGRRWCLLTDRQFKLTTINTHDLQY